MKSLTPLLLLGVALTGNTARAQLFNELFINPPGTDNGLEFIELRGTPGQSLTGLTILTIDGDHTSIGIVDQVISLSGLSLGSNGLLLWRDAATILSPGPAAGTTVNTVDFSPDIENGSNTYLLVSGFTGTSGSDLDTNNDGTLDLTPWTSVADAVALKENDSANVNFTYLTSVGFSDVDASAGFNAEALVRVETTGPQGKQWVYADVSGSTPGPFPVNPAQVNYQDGSSAVLPEGAGLTPGAPNFAAVPEPEEYAALFAASLGAFALLRRRFAKK